MVGVIYFVYKLFNWNTFSAGVIPIVILFSIFAFLQLLFMGVIGEYILAILLMPNALLSFCLMKRFVFV